MGSCNSKPDHRRKGSAATPDAQAPSGALRVLLIDDGAHRISLMHDELSRQGHLVVGVLDSALLIHDCVLRLQPDVVILDSESPSRDTLENLAVMDRAMPRPVIILTQEGDQEKMREAFRAGVSAYVVDNLDLARLKPIIDVAIARFEAHQNLRRELADATRKLSERKLIDKAKGILMKTRGLDEEAAYTALRKLAMERAQPIGKVAGELIEMARLLL